MTFSEIPKRIRELVLPRRLYGKVMGFYLKFCNGCEAIAIPADRDRRIAVDILCCWKRSFFRQMHARRKKHSKRKERQPKIKMPLNARRSVGCCMKAEFRKHYERLSGKPCPGMMPRWVRQLAESKGGE